MKATATATETAITTLRSQIGRSEMFKGTSTKGTVKHYQQIQQIQQQ
jgi:hypothetical protein